MPVIVALVMLWFGVFLDMASTYFTFGTHGDQLSEVNQLVYPGNPNFFVANALISLVLSAAVMFVLIDWETVKKYIRQTGLGTYLKELTTMKYYRKEDFVSFKVVTLVSIPVFVGSVGGGRFLAFVNNVLESYGYVGFMRLFLSTFSVHDQLAVSIVFTISLLAFFPITYILLRSSVR